MISTTPSASRRLFGRLRATLSNVLPATLIIDPAGLSESSPPAAESRRRLVLGAGRVVVIREPPPRPK